jgi:hypothetical protein
MQTDIMVTAPPGSAIRYGGESEVECTCAQNTFAANFQNVINIPQQGCAIPTQFRKVQGGDDIGDGRLHFIYWWESTSGNLNHLLGCFVEESVTHPTDPFLWPAPFPDVQSSDFVRPIRGETGGLQDFHEVPNPGPFRTPFFPNAVTRYQTYQFHCPCHQNDAVVPLMGPLEVTRTVWENPPGYGNWYYTVSKTGSAATMPLP